MVYKTAQFGWYVCKHLQILNLKLAKGNFHCLCIQSQNTTEKWQAILNHLQEHIQNTCDGCEYTTTNQVMECADKNNETVTLRAELFSLSNMTEHILESIRLWIYTHSTTRSIVVQGLSLYLETDCSLTIKSFDSPLNCLQASAPTLSSSSNPPVTHTSTVTTDQPQKRHPSTVIEVLAITGFLGCGILIMIILLLVLYIACKHYKESSQKAQRLR